MSTRNRVIDSSKKQSTRDWHKADIVASIWKLGTSLQRLSRKNGLAADTLNMTLHRPWPKGERIIATAIGVAPQSIWPSRYHPDGTPRSGRGERGIGRLTKNSTGRRTVNVERRRAA